MLAVRLPIPFPFFYPKEKDRDLSRPEGKNSVSYFVVFFFFSSSFSSSDETGTLESRLVPPITCGEEEEEEMTTILRTGFRDRQLNSLFESIVIDLSSSKKARLATSSDFPSRPTPSTPTIVVISSSDEKSSSVGNIPYHEMRKPFVVSVSVNEELFECANPSPLYLKPTYVPS